MNKEAHEHEFPPLYDADSRILILGSFPSVKSREQKFFYGHPQNRFWKVLALSFNEDTPLTILEKRDFCARHHIALYDSIERCVIHGSSDASIEQVEPADLSVFFKNAKIEKILINGKASARYFHQYQTVPDGVELIELPSTSAANAATSLTQLLEKWGPALKN